VTEAANGCKCDQLYEISARTKQGLRFGFIDCKGKVVVEPKFLSVGDFSDGVAVVQLGEEVAAERADGRRVVSGTYGIIDLNGFVTVVPNSILFSSFSEGLSLARVNGKFAYIDKTGVVAIAIPEKVEILDEDYSSPEEFGFTDGVAGLKARDGGIYLVSREGKFTKEKAAPLRFDEQGLAITEVNGAQAIVNKAGKYVFGPTQAELDSSEGIYWAVPKGGNQKYTFLNPKGEVLFERRFEEIGYFHEGLMTVKKKGKWGFMDKGGVMKIAAGFTDAHDFSEGLAAVESGGKWGYVDRAGAIVVPAAFSSAGEFSCGLARVQGEGFDGYIDKKGNWIWKTTKS